MNILLLSNSAPNYFHFFNALATCFSKDGHRVVVAVDSTFSREENRLDSLGFPIYNFSEFFRSHQIDSAILQQYSDFNLNSALLSDFERAEAYKIWGNDVDINFYDRLKSALLTYFESIFEERKIDLVLYENVSNAFAHFALFVSQKRGAQYCGIGGSRLPGRFSITDDPLSDKRIENIFREIQNGQREVSTDLRQWATEYISNIEIIIPDYMKTNGLDQTRLLKRYLRRDRLGKIKALIRHATDKPLNAFQIGNPLRTHINLFLRNVKRRFKLKRVKRLYVEPVADETFLLYPLHFHPESSTSILAGTYLDEYEVIRNIAFNLPEGVRLYVKDHISAWGYPTLDFYQRIKRLPNVRLLEPNAPTKKLIKASAGVITLTSTVGYEALLLGKPVYLFGEVFYAFHKGVTRIKDPSKIHELVLANINQLRKWDDYYNNNFVCAYHLTTLAGSLNLTAKSEPANINAEQIYKILKKLHCLNRFFTMTNATLDNDNQ